MAINAYEYLKWAYPLKLCTIEQMKTAVIKKKITEAQYKEITGYNYPNPN